MWLTERELFYEMEISTEFLQWKVWFFEKKVSMNVLPKPHT